MHPQNSLEVNDLIEYKIPLKGLSSGEHYYQYHITGKFFEAVQSDEEYRCDIDVDVALNVESNLMVLNLKYKGTMTFPCDICLDDYVYPTDFERRLVVKRGEEKSDDDDIIYLSHSEHILDISRIIFEDIVLNVPLRKVHPLDAQGHSTCNAEFLDLMEKYHNQKKPDHRWDALKDLKFDD